MGYWPEVRGVTICGKGRTKAPKSPRNVTKYFLQHLLLKDLLFEHGGAKLASCPGHHLTFYPLLKCLWQLRSHRTPYSQWCTQNIFMGSFWFRVIWWSFVFGVLFVTSQFDVISMFPNQRFGEVCWHNNAYFSTSTPLISCGIALNINYQRSKLGYRRKINSTLRHSSS